MPSAAKENQAIVADRPLESFFGALERDSEQTSTASAEDVADVVRKARGNSTPTA